MNPHSLNAHSNQKIDLNARKETGDHVLSGLETGLISIE